MSFSHTDGTRHLFAYLHTQFGLSGISRFVMHQLLLRLVVLLEIEIQQKDRFNRFEVCERLNC